MLHLQKSHAINAKPEAVWAVLGRYMHIDEFSPFIVSVDALTNGKDGVGSKRRNHFENGTSLVEEVTKWDPNHSYTVRLSEMASNPIRDASAKISVQSLDGQRTTVNWSFDFRVKYGPLGWLLGQTMMRLMMGKIIVANLKGLEAKVSANSLSAAR